MMISGLKQIEALESKMWNTFSPRLWVTLNYTQNNLPVGPDRFKEHSNNIKRYLNKIAKASKRHLSAIVATENIDRLHGHLVVYSEDQLSTRLIDCWKYSAEGKSVAREYNEELKQHNSDYMLVKHHLDTITLTNKGKVRIYCPQLECGAR